MAAVHKWVAARQQGVGISGMVHQPIYAIQLQMPVALPVIIIADSVINKMVKVFM